jgi:hypothetical protein
MRLPAKARDLPARIATGGYILHSGLEKWHGDESDQMSFVHMFQFTTSDLEGIRRVDEEWRKATEGKRTVRREVIAADRNQPGRYFAIVFFDSYESAMENSNLPETQAAAAQYMELSDGQPVFYDLDVIEDRS